MKAIWGTSFGFPGPLPVEPFKQYIRRNEFVANHYWSAYPGATLTVLTPIIEGHESALARYLNALQGGANSPLASVPGTHFARFSFAGLRALKLPDASLAGFPEEFRQGMAARAELLGDMGDSAPDNWEGRLGSSAVHVLVMISAEHDKALQTHDKRLRAALERNGGLSLLYTDMAPPSRAGRALRLPGRVRAAGDRGCGTAIAARTGSSVERRRVATIRAGEFILGYPDEEGVLPTAPPPDELSGNGSYLVYRKLHQDVAAFRRRLAESARLYPDSEDRLAAKIVGRCGTAPRSTSRPNDRTPPSSPTSSATTPSATARTRAGCAARWAPTSGEPILG